MQHIFKSSSIKVILLGFILSFSISCGITRTSGFYSGYKRLTPEIKSKIVRVDDSETIPPLKDSITYAITAKHLEQILRKSSKSIVYFWQPQCSGSVCVSIPAFQKYCQLNGYRPIIIAQYYDYEMMKVQGVNPNNVLAINHWHYKTDYCVKYLKRFKKSIFKSFKTEYNKEIFSKYLYFDGKVLSTNRPSDLTKYPWQG